MTAAPIRPWWQLVQQALAEGEWATAEGALRRLLDLQPERPELLDLLAYALLMQGQFQGCEVVLRQALACGGCSFWTPHKLGDALRGQQRLEEAVAAYEQALAWGSDSPLTARNLLLVLEAINPEQALARLDEWAHGLEDTAAHWLAPPFWLAGALEAALTSGGLELAFWLHRHGCRDPEIRRLALQEAVMRFDWSAALQLAEGPLKQRLVCLLAP